MVRKHFDVFSALHQCLHIFKYTLQQMRAFGNNPFFCFHCVMLLWQYGWQNLTKNWYSGSRSNTLSVKICMLCKHETAYFSLFGWNVSSLVRVLLFCASYLSNYSFISILFAVTQKCGVFQSLVTNRGYKNYRLLNIRLNKSYSITASIEVKQNELNRCDNK